MLFSFLINPSITIIGRLVLYQDEIDWNERFEESFER
jgi:hypothetical protein